MKIPFPALWKGVNIDATYLFRKLKRKAETEEQLSPEGVLAITLLRKL